MNKAIVLIDAGTGNLRSVQKALEAVGANVLRTDDPTKVVSGGRVVLPGVGAFGDFMSGLRALGLEEAVNDTVQRGIPLLGICVGLQALFEVGEEMGEHKGLGLLQGKVVNRMTTKPASQETPAQHTARFAVPHSFSSFNIRCHSRLKPFLNTN